MKESIGDLFLAGILPGVMILMLFAIYCYIDARIKGIEPEPRATWKERFYAIRKVMLPMGFPVLVVGVFTAAFSAR